ncbi:MAG: hypothetical protein HZB15_02150 [Actinobacteria bacterium]|nr:hypothetical protein [Actinomycetota bacterium]
MRAQTTRFRAVNTAVIPIPVVLMLIPLAVGRSFFENTVGLERFSVEYWVAAVVLVVGGISCGYGLAGASRTIVLAQALSRERGRFAPYAGIPSQMASWLADFCFSSALLFGLGGSLLFPGVTSAILGSHGVARATFVIVVVIIVGCTAALLAVPAQFLSRRHTTERDDYLNKLSKKIDVLAARAANPQATFSENEYRQLRSLLELRNHVVLQSIAQPSVEMVKRIPLAVLLPVGSTAAAWLAVLVH